MNSGTIADFRKKLDTYGLQKFIHECRFTLCQRTVNPTQLAVFFRLHNYEIEAAVGPFSKNGILYDLIWRVVPSAQEFLEGLCETGNEHIINDVVKEKFERSSPQNNPNATIIVTLGQSRNTFRVNVQVLAERSPEFRERLERTGDGNENQEMRLVDQTGEPIYTFHDVDPTSFQIILDYFSTNTLVVGTIDRTNCCRLFHDAKKLGVWTIQGMAMNFIATEAEHVLDDVEYFTADDWIEILSGNDLRVPSEIFLFQKVQKWFEFRQDHELEMKRIMTKIRFLQMTAEELIFVVMPTKFVPETFLYDSVLQILGSKKRHEQGFSNKPREYCACENDSGDSNDSTKSKNDVEQTQEYLKLGASHIKLDPDCKKVVLVVGKTGVGKTTLCQILSRNTHNLSAYKYGIGRKFVIKDNEEKIGSSSTISKTIFPELMITSNNQLALYDCPGFEDTRSEALEIANSFFIKSVAEFAQDIKILVVINASYFDPGNRSDIPDMIKQTLSLIKPIKKYQNSIALLVNMADPSISATEVSQFLGNVAQELDRTNWSSDLKSRGRQLIQGLQSKIQFFKCPSKEGPLAESEDICSDRDNLLEFLMNQLDFVPSSDGDFGHSLSAEALLLRTGLLDKVKQDIKGCLEEIAQIAKQIYTKNIIDLVDFLEDIIHNPERVPKDVDVKLVAFKSLIHNLTTIEQYFVPSTFQAVNDIPNFIKNLQSTITEKIDALSQSCESQLKALEHHQKTWKFLLEFGEQPPLPDFVSLGQPLTSLNNFFQFIFPLSAQNRERVVLKFLDQLNRDVSTAIMYLVNQLKDFYRNTFFLGSGTGSNSKHLDLISLKMECQFNYWTQTHGALHQSCKEIPKLSTAIELALQNVPDLKETPCLDNLSLYTSILHEREYHRQLLQNLVESSSAQLKGNPETWIQSFGTPNLLSFLEESRLWYDFLKNLQIMLSTYQVQKKINTMDLKITEQLKTLSNLDGFITNKSLNNLTTRLISDPFCISVTVPPGLLPDYSFTKIDPHDNSRRYDELCKLLDGVFSNQITTQVEGSDKLVIKGRFIVLSQIVGPQGKWDTNIKAVEIYASDTIFIDSDLDAIGRNLCLSISSPTWHVVGSSRKIKLDGAAGANGNDGLASVPTPIPPTPAYYDEGTRKRVHSISAGDGNHGQPGQPGSPGGSFFGVGLKFINSENLEISACGGQGGHGGHGSAGQPGSIGVDAVQPTDGTPEPPISSAYGFQGHPTPPERIGLGRGGSVYKVYFKICGQPSVLHGGNGGNGGKSGEGGLAGTISIVSAENDSEPESQPKINITALPGQPGQGGTGGAPGAGGRGGKTMNVRYERRKTKGTFGNVDGTNCTWHSLGFEDSDAAGNSPQGQAGVDNLNSAGISMPMLSSWDASFCRRVMYGNFITFLTESIKSHPGFWLAVLNLTIEEIIDKIRLISAKI